MSRHQRRTRKHTDRPRPEIVIRRPNLRFDAERSKRWMHGGARTLVMHAMSAIFPGAERFLIKSVMAFKDRIDDPQVREEMRRFAAQEAIHTRQHLVYDAAVQEHYDLKTIEDLVDRDFSRLFDRLSRTDSGWFDGPRAALAITVAAEHVTAMLARQVLSNSRFFEGADAEFARLWQWHAAEEMEHKAVSFDVFEAIGGSWLERSLALIIINNVLLFGLLQFSGRFLRADGQAWSPRAWADVLSFLFGSPGLFRKALPDFLDFFRPGFHPWDHDDRQLLARWQASGDAVEPASAS
jgi:hypothetical protein